MYINYYDDLKQLVTNNLPAVKHIDWYNDQYTRYEQVKATAFPALYVEFENPLSWETHGNGLQVAVNATIRFHLVLFDVNDNPEQQLQLAQQLHQLLHLHKINDINTNEQISTPLMRTSSELITEYDQLKVVILTYSTALYDYSTIKQTTSVNVSPNVSGGF